MVNIFSDLQIHRKDLIKTSLTQGRFNNGCFPDWISLPKNELFYMEEWLCSKYGMAITSVVASCNSSNAFSVQLSGLLKINFLT